MDRRGVLRGLALAALSSPGRAAEAPWAPSRPVTVLVPLAPGSSGDILARSFAEAWTPRLHQPVLVENRAAAGGIVGTEALRNAAPDGHTLGLVAQGTLVFTYFLSRVPHYDARQDLTLIAPFAAITNAVVVGRNSPLRSIEDIVAVARRRPGLVTYSSGGVGTSHHISMALFAQLTGTTLAHVPYRGAPAGILAVVAGEVAVGCYNIPTVLAQIQAGELRALAVTSAGRSGFLHAVPSLRELGLSEYELTTWMGLGAPRRIPAAVLRRMADETSLALDEA